MSTLSPWPDLFASLIGNRTRMVAIAAFVAAAAARWGFQIDPAVLVEIMVVGFPILMVVMRQFTHTPAGSTEPKPMVIGQTAEHQPIVARTPANSPTIVQAEVPRNRPAPDLKITPVLGTAMMVDSTQYPGDRVMVQEVRLAPAVETPQGSG